MSLIDLGWELEAARNGLDRPLCAAARRRLLDALAHPCEATWEAAYTVILGGRGMTLWGAMVAVRPGFPRRRSPGARWPIVPDRAALVAAIRYATH